MPTTVKDIEKLTPRQREVLGDICLNSDMGHHPATLNALEKKGLIYSKEQTLPGRFPVKIKRWTYHMAAHIAWCAWCSKHPEEVGT